MTQTQARIAEILTQYGLGVPCDPRWIEAAVRCDGLDPELLTITSVMCACRKVSKRPADDNEVLAKSYGL